MKNYIFDCHYGQCSLADEETGIVIEWRLGKYEETKSVHCEGTILPEEGTEEYMNEILAEMQKCISEDYQDYL